jgi:hypothetical protein
MRYWCFNCEKITIPQPGFKCQFCASDALEEMRDRNNPAQYIPYNVPVQMQSQTLQQQQQQPQQNQQNQQNQQEPLVRVSFFQTSFMMPPFLAIPPISIFRLFGLAGP